MRELELLVNNLNDELQKKENELSYLDGFNSYIMGHLTNRKNEIQKFKQSIPSESTDPIKKKQIISSYSKKAKRIINEINKISVR